MGKRMRPHTLTVPKPLLPVAGKPIVQRLVEDIAKMVDMPLGTIAFIIGPNFGSEVEAHLLAIAREEGAEGKIFYQEEALGTAHAVACAEECLEGPVIVAFADTLFRADFKINPEMDGVIWVHKVSDPKAFGVVKLDEHQIITDFIEKPEQFVSDLAIIGIYYFRDGVRLRHEINFLLENNIREKGEYQLTNALENMKQKGYKFTPGEVIEWWDCGNKNATVYTNQRVLANLNGELSSRPSVTIENSTVIEPCFLDEGVVLRNTTIGPYVSVGKHTILENSVISNSIIQEHTLIRNANFTNSMVGNHAVYDGDARELSIGDYCQQSE